MYAAQHVSISLYISAIPFINFFYLNPPGKLYGRPILECNTHGLIGNTMVFYPFVTADLEIAEDGDGGLDADSCTVRVCK
jgi:hypothetical protein